MPTEELILVPYYYPFHDLTDPGGAPIGGGLTKRLKVSLLKGGNRS